MFSLSRIKLRKLDLARPTRDGDVDGLRSLTIAQIIAGNNPNFVRTAWCDVRDGVVQELFSLEVRRDRRSFIWVCFKNNTCRFLRRSSFCNQQWHVGGSLLNICWTFNYNNPRSDRSCPATHTRALAHVHAHAQPKHYHDNVCPGKSNILPSVNCHRVTRMPSCECWLLMAMGFVCDNM